MKLSKNTKKGMPDADVVVVGGGPGGIGAAVSAARNGADTVLIELNITKTVPLFMRQATGWDIPLRNRG